MEANAAGAAPPGRCAFCSVGERSDWAHLPDHCADVIDRLKVRRGYERDEALFRQGDDNAGLHCVSRGVFGLRMTHENGADVLFGLAYPGDVLGARAFLRNGPHMTSAVALTDGAVCTVRRRDALKLTQDAPTVHLQLVKRCLNAMDAAQSELVRVAAMSNRARLCRLMAALLRAHGEQAGDGWVEARLPVSRADMAGMLGVQPESLSRLFRRLKLDGLIDYSGRTVRAASVEALAAAAEDGEAAALRA